MNNIWFRELYTDHLGVMFRIKDMKYSNKSPFQEIVVVDTYEFGRALLLDGKTMLTEKDEHIYHEMIVHSPMTINPLIKKVLIIGGGDGGSVRELVKYSTIESIDLVDIDKEVIEVSKKYLQFTAQSLDDPRVHIYNEDGSEFVKKIEKEHYDLAIIDSTDPVGPGAKTPAFTLITEEFLENVAEVLTKSGIFIAQTESPSYEAEYLKSYHKKLRKYFNYIAPRIIMVPSYSGLWSLTFASNVHDFYSLNLDSLKTKESLNVKYFSSEFMKYSILFGKYLPY